jgi:hypothetical protein
MKHAPEEFTSFYEKRVDTLFVELQETPVGVSVAIVQIGEEVGFPGQIVARVDPETHVIYGVVIEKWSRIDRQLTNAKAKEDAKLALQQLIQKIMDALREVCGGVLPEPEFA